MKLNKEGIGTGYYPRVFQYPSVGGGVNIKPYHDLENGKKEILHENKTLTNTEKIIQAIRRRIIHTHYHKIICRELRMEARSSYIKIVTPSYVVITSIT